MTMATPSPLPHCLPASSATRPSPPRAEQGQARHQITVADVGDFRVGQGVMVSKRSIHASYATLWGPHKDYAAVEHESRWTQTKTFSWSNEPDWMPAVI